MKFHALSMFLRRFISLHYIEKFKDFFPSKIRKSKKSKFIQVEIRLDPQNSLGTSTSKRKYVNYLMKREKLEEIFTQKENK